MLHYSNRGNFKKKSPGPLRDAETMTEDNLNERLKLGIEAARSGQEKEAREHLLAVLQQDRHHVPAMLWLAFVLPSPHDSIRILQQVLSLEPDNKRAQAGIRWAKSRLGMKPDDPLPERTEEEISEQSLSLRQKLLAKGVQEEAQKGMMAQRARRTIDPLVLLLLLSGTVALLAVGIGLLALGPTTTLAAWLPPPTRPVEDVSRLSLAVPTRPLHLAAAADTLVATATPQPPQNIPAVSPPPAVLPLAEPVLASIEPSGLIGPQAAFSPTTAIDSSQLAYEPATPDEKWIEVDVTAQQVTAWEGDQPVYLFTVSTGLSNTPTVLGQYRIYWKLESTLMAGPSYYLPDVPYTMYFYGGYALHGTYWHDNFGQPMSHGCINLRTEEAQKLFEWADPVIPTGQTAVVASAENPGTVVVIHD